MMRIMYYDVNFMFVQSIFSAVKNKFNAGANVKNFQFI